MFYVFFIGANIYLLLSGPFGCVNLWNDKCVPPILFLQPRSAKDQAQGIAKARATSGRRVRGVLNGIRRPMSNGYFVR